MNNGELLALIGTILLAIYGCAQVIRQLCLKLTRCPKCVRQFRLAIPGKGVSLETLIFCLQAQSVWREADCDRTVLLLSTEELSEENLLNVLEKAPSVTAMTSADLLSFVENGGYLDN